jgi:proteasome accessory factor B
VLLLQSDRYPNARELAAHCEVCRRTIYRDLEMLVEAGIPIRFRADRQGYHLAPGSFLPPTGLEESEVLAIQVMARRWEGGDALGLLRPALSGAVKLVQALPPDRRDHLLAAADLFREGAGVGTTDSPARREIYDTVLAALTRQKQIRLWYQERGGREEESTKFATYRALLSDRTWYLVGRSSRLRRVIVIGVPWIIRAALTDEGYEVPPRFCLDRFLGRAWGVDRGPIRYKVWLRFAPAAATAVRDTVWHPSQRCFAMADGSIDVYFLVDGLEEILGWVLRFGDEVEVLGPEELRERLLAVATELARRYGTRTAAFGPGREAVASGVEPAAGQDRVVDSSRSPIRMSDTLRASTGA